MLTNNVNKTASLLKYVFRSSVCLNPSMNEFRSSVMRIL